MIYDQAKTFRSHLEACHQGAADHMRSIGAQSGAQGITPDEVKFTTEYREAFAHERVCFFRLREFNSYLVKHFADEMRAERNAKFG